MIVINFKNYVIGKPALKLAKKIQKFLPNSIVAVPTLDIEQIAKKTKLKVYAQHISYFKKGKVTGFTIAEFAKYKGAKGSLLNHSEHPLQNETIKKTTKEAKSSKLKIILCTSSLKQAKKLKSLKPYAMAFEDKKLIGRGKSITKYKAKDVKTFSKLLKNTKIIPLCGAGINSKEDVIAAKKLGCKGVLIASAIANAKSPEKLLRDISRI